MSEDKIVECHQKVKKICCFVAILIAYSSYAKLTRKRCVL